MKLRLLLFMSSLLFLSACGSLHLGINLSWGDGQTVESSTKLKQKGEQGRGISGLFEAPTPEPSPAPELPA